MLAMLFGYCVAFYDMYDSCLCSVLVKGAWEVLLIDYRNAEQIYDSKIKQESKAVVVVFKGLKTYKFACNTIQQDFCVSIWL